MPEIFTERLPFHGTRAVVDTHWIEYDEPALGRGQKRAICGAVVDEDTFSTDPTCAACRERMAAIERMEF